jgi:hypothetical protein
MARIRSVKPELRTSLTVVQWPREVRYFWVLLWGYLDDHGYGVDDVRLIKADCFPLDDDITVADVDKWLDLIAHTIVPDEPPPLCRYEVHGRRFLHATKWADHQRPQHPGMPKHPPCSRDHLMNGSGMSHETLSGDPSLPGDNFPARNDASERQQPESGPDQGVPLSGESHETLTPEQVEEQGAGRREQGAVARAREPRNRSAVTLLGNALLEEHRRLIKPSLPRDVGRRVGEKIDLLLDDPEISPDEVREGLRRLRANRKFGPGMLPDLVHEVRQERAGQGEPPPRGRSPARGSTTDARVGTGLDLAARYAAQENAAQIRELPA